IVAIAGSTWEAMALRRNGVIYTWGFNSGGQLGNGTAISDYCLYATPMTSGYCSISPCPQNALTITGGTLPICRGDGVILNASGSTNYIWSPSTGLTCTTCGNPSAYPDSTITYIVTGYSGACSFTDSVTITVKPSPPPPLIMLSNDTLYF